MQGKEEGFVLSKLKYTQGQREGGSDEERKEGKSHWVFRGFETEQQSTAPRWAGKGGWAEPEEEVELSGHLCWEFSGKSRMMEGSGSTVRA